MAIKTNPSAIDCFRNPLLFNETRPDFSFIVGHQHLDTDENGTFETASMKKLRKAAEFRSKLNPESEEVDQEVIPVHLILNTPAEQAENVEESELFESLLGDGVIPGLEDRRVAVVSIEPNVVCEVYPGVVLFRTDDYSTDYYRGK